MPLHPFKAFKSIENQLYKPSLQKKKKILQFMQIFLFHYHLTLTLLI